MSSSSHFFTEVFPAALKLMTGEVKKPPLAVLNLIGMTTGKQRVKGRNSAPVWGPPLAILWGFIAVFLGVYEHFLRIFLVVKGSVSESLWAFSAHIFGGERA